MQAVESNGNLAKEVLCIVWLGVPGRLVRDSIVGCIATVRITSDHLKTSREGGGASSIGVIEQLVVPVRR